VDWQAEPSFRANRPKQIRARLYAGGGIGEARREEGMVSTSSSDGRQLPGTARRFRLLWPQRILFGTGRDETRSSTHGWANRHLRPAGGGHPREVHGTSRDHRRASGLSDRGRPSNKEPSTLLANDLRRGRAPIVNRRRWPSTSDWGAPHNRRAIPQRRPRHACSARNSAEGSIWDERRSRAA